MAQRICWIGDCGSSAIARGLCNAHYRRWRRNPGGQVQPEPPRPKPTCSIEGCASEVKARGWCRKHYKRWCDHGSTDLPERPAPATKICSACGVEGPTEDFPPKRLVCSECRREQQRRWREANRERLSAQRARYWRENKAELQEYHRQRNERLADELRAKRRRYYLANADRLRREKAEYRAANRERERENMRRWRAAHRAELLGREMERYWLTRTLADSVHLIEARIAYYGGKCWICRTADYEHLDHVKPLAKGGLHLPANLRPACAPCNIRKRDRWPFAPEDIAA